MKQGVHAPDIESKLLPYRTALTERLAGIDQWEKREGKKRKEKKALIFDQLADNDGKIRGRPQKANILFTF